MSKSAKTKARSDDWAFDMPAGVATHAPTGLRFVLEPLRANGREIGQAVDGYVVAGRCSLPPDTPDARQPGQIDAGDANAPGVLAWVVVAEKNALQAALSSLTAERGRSQAEAMLARIAREAGERWVFRARLERKWADGRRAT